MHLDVITLFPQMVEVVAAYGVTRRAIQRGVLSLETWCPRDYAADKYRSVDDRPYGGGPGMVMMVEPLRRCIRAAREQAATGTKTVYLSPQGRLMDQQAAISLAQAKGLILVAGRYEGVDERLIQLEIDEEWSVGNYILSGGELAAMIMVDALARLQPGGLGHGESALQDSFMEGLLDFPQYTRPYEVAGLKVPEVLLSGNHAEIERWRHKQSLGRTGLRRPELLRSRGMSEEECDLFAEFMSEQREQPV